MVDHPSIIDFLTPEEQDALIKCPHFATALARALNVLEQDDHYNVTMPLRDIETALFKLVISARANIYSKRLRKITEKLNGRS